MARRTSTRAARHRLRCNQLRRGRSRRGGAAGNRAARRLHHRHAQDLRSHVRRDDLLDLRTRTSAPIIPASWCCRRAPPNRATPRPTCSASTTWSSTSRSPRTAATACRCAGMAREIACAYDLDFVDPADVAPLPADGRGVAGDGRSPAPACCASALRPVTGIDPTARVAVVDAAQAAAQRHPCHLACGRRHQLRDARTGPPACTPTTAA